MRYNRFYVLGGVSFTSCAVVRLWRVLQVFTMCLADGVTVCVCAVPSAVGVGLCILLACAVVCCWREDGACWL